MEFFLLQNVMICHYADGNLVKEVKECPMNEALWMGKSKEICNYTQDTPYHCLPTDSLNGFVEGCLKVRSIQPGTDSGLNVLGFVFVFVFCWVFFACSTVLGLLYTH